MPKCSGDLPQVLLARVRQEGIVNVVLVLAASLMVTGFIVLSALLSSYFGTLMIAGGVVLLIVKVFGFLLRAPTYGTANSGENTAMRYHSDIRGDV